MGVPISVILTIIEGPDAGKQIILDQPELIIGRAESADLSINTPVISRRHCRIYLQGGRYFIEDLGSSNGTFLNGQRLEASKSLSDGDQVALGGAIRINFTQPADNLQTALMDGSKTMVETALPAQAVTVEGLGVPVEELSRPPQLSVSIASGLSATYSLVANTYNIGRLPGNEILIESPIVSGQHAVLKKTAGPQAGAAAFILHILPEAANPFYYRGEALTTPLTLHDGDLLRIGSRDPEMMVTLIYHNPAEIAERQLTRQVQFSEKNQIKIGRDAQNDIVLNNPAISRYHAMIERVGQRYRVRDLGSTNGTFMNDERIHAETWLAESDHVRVGAYRFLLEMDGLSAHDESSGVRVEVRSLNKWVRKDLNLLKDLSLNFNPREFIVVVGQSGGGKSTLVDAIAGYRPATHGSVVVNGTDIYKHFDSIRNEIGFVPQKDIIHMELTVYQALDYAAQLRMPSDTSPEERRQRVLEVLHDLDLEHRQDVQISGLSGGQQKRVSIGVELLTKPGLFFLDEPTSGLDPGTETALMQLMRRLADQGRTIILITHATKNVMLADKVVFLARGGYLAWFGPPDEALKYFDSFRSEMDRRTKPMEFDDIYAILDDPGKGNAAEWAERYRQQPAYQRYIVQPLGLQSALAPQQPSAPAPQRPSTPAPQRSASGSRQLKILSARNIKILTRDRTSLILMLAAPVAIAMLDVVMAVVLGRDLFDYQTGSMFNAITSFFMTLMYALLVGAYSQMREFVKENEIYKRERLVNLRVLPYVSSKVWVAFLLAIYQAVIFTGIHHLAYKMPGGALEIGVYFFTMFLAILAGMMMGLFASALAPNANAAPLMVLLLVVPTLVMAGAMIPLPNSLTGISATRWAYQALIGISGGGSDIAADACWALPDEERDSLTLEEKAARGCICMGQAIFDQDSCNYPGLGAEYDPVIDVAEPPEPAPIGDSPIQPALPAAPVPPADPNDAEANAQFLLALKDHQQEVERISQEFEEQLNAYQDRAEQFKTDMEAYQKARAEWEIDRNSAVAKAEGLIKSLYVDYSWTYVDKDDKGAFWSMLLTSWGVLALISLILFGGILFFISRKS